MSKIWIQSGAAFALALLIAGNANAGEPNSLTIPGCADPSSSGVETGEYFELSPLSDQCFKGCKDLFKACLGVAKAQLSCAKKSTKPGIKLALRNCAEDPETEDACRAELEPQIDAVLEEIKAEKTEIQDACEGLGLECLSYCEGQLKS